MNEDDFHFDYSQIYKTKNIQRILAMQENDCLNL